LLGQAPGSCWRASYSPCSASSPEATLALTVSYSLWWRNVVVLDIVAIAAGFILRAVAGGVATDIYLSRWFVIVNRLLCRLPGRGESATPSFGRAASPVPVRATPRALLAGQAAADLGRRCPGPRAVRMPAGAFTRGSHGAWYGLSIAPFLLWLVRYTRLVEAGTGEAPRGANPARSSAARASARPGCCCSSAASMSVAELGAEARAGKERSLAGWGPRGAKPGRM